MSNAGLALMLNNKMSIPYEKVVLKHVSKVTPKTLQRQPSPESRTGFVPIVLTIKEMQKYAILWNTNHPEYRLKQKRTKALLESANRIGITVDRLAKNVKYVKRKYYAELRLKEKVDSGKLDPNSYVEWKWFEKCAFLKNWKEFMSKNQSEDLSSIVPTINEMQKHAILWDTNHPDRLTEKKTKALRESASRIGITADRLAKNVTYIKRKFCAELRFKEKIDKGELDLTSYVQWKWFEKCAFLKKWEGYKPKYLMPNNPTEDLEESMDVDENTSTRSEDEMPESTTVYIVDTKSNDQESQDDPLNSPEITEDTMDATSMSPESDVEPENPPSTSHHRDNKQFQINSVCKSLSFLLSNDQVTEDNVVDFHSDVLAFAYSYLKKKRKK